MRFTLIVTLFLAFACSSLPATFTVNSTADVVDANPGDGVCETGAGNGICTLRAAVQEAGASSGASQIVLPAGTYLLSATPSCSYRLVTNTNLLSGNTSALCVSGNVTIVGAGSDSTIIDAGGAGGATCCGSYPSARGMVIPLGSVVTLSGVTIQNGLSSGGYSFFGGAAINNQGTLNITDCTLTANNGIPGGGGIWNDGTLVADNVLFTANTGSTGAGLYNSSYGKAEISNSTFDLNVAGTGGGAIDNTGSLKILSSTISNNVSGGNGGAISNDYATVALTNVTIVNNQGSSGGAIWNYQSGIMTVNNSTIVQNRATNSTGGVANANSFTVSNSIIGGNYETWEPTVPTDCSGPITSQGHNLISSITGTCRVTGATSSDIYNVAPGVAALAPNGGSTQTAALTSTSPELDRGDPSTPGTGGTSCAAADQRGFLRPQNGLCDIGAFERSSSLSVTTITPHHAGNTSPAEAVLSGGGFASGAAVKLQRAGQSDIVASPVTVQDGNAAAGVVFDLTGKAPGSWDVVFTNPDGTSSTLLGAFQIDAGGSANVWAEVGGPALVRPGTSPTYWVLFGNRGNVDALDVPITLSVQTSIPLAVNFGVQPPPAQPGQVATDWSQVPMYVTPGPSGGFVNVPLLLPIIPAGFTGSLKFSITVPTTLQHGAVIQLYAASGDPFLQVGGDPSALVSQLAAGAVVYAQENLRGSVSASNQALGQYILNQLQDGQAAARAQFSATSGSIPLVYSLGQLNIDAANFAAANATGGVTPKIAFAKNFKAADSSEPSNTVLCSTPDGKIVTLRVGGVQPAGSSCKDPETYIPPPPCAAG